jgi:Fic family protein
LWKAKRLQASLCKGFLKNLYTIEFANYTLSTKFRMKSFVPQSLPIKEIAWEPLIPLIGAANRALARYDGSLYGVPNAAVLLAPLTTQEAVLSSKIEGTVATLSDVLNFDAGEAPTEPSRQLDVFEIINYRQALRDGESAVIERPFNLNLLLSLHSTLLDSVRGANKSRGRFRTTQNWIGRPGCSITRADFVPPAPEDVPGAMSDWEKHYHAEQPDALVQLAVIHAQFEIIHPFNDGNGRLGRMLVPLFLFEKKLLHRPTFYLSAYLEEHREEYINCLRPLGREAGAWNRWIAFFLRALTEEADANGEKARKIMDLYESLKAQVLSLTHSRYAIPLLDSIFERPIFRSSSLERRKGMPSKPMIMNMLGKLKNAGILKVRSEGRGRRAQVLVLPALVTLCEAKTAY